jgi:hypothetical protein
MNESEELVFIDPLEEPAIVTEEEALGWLHQVDGSIYQNSQSDSDEGAWVAVVQTPAAPGQIGNLIIAFGESLTDATSVAEEQWQRYWSSIGLIH